MCVALASFPGSHYPVFDHLQCAKMGGGRPGPFYQIGEGGEGASNERAATFDLLCWSSECLQSENIATHTTTIKARVTQPLNSVKVLSCYAGSFPDLQRTFCHLQLEEGLSITPIMFSLIPTSCSTVL